MPRTEIVTSQSSMVFSADHDVHSAATVGSDDAEDIDIDIDISTAVLGTGVGLEPGRWIDCVAMIIEDSDQTFRSLELVEGSSQNIHHHSRILW